MTIDEAILHAEEVAESKEKQIKNGDWEKDSLTERNCIKCAEEHRQLAEWLKDYKRLKEQPEITWVTGADGAKVAFWDVPIPKVLKICEILQEPTATSTEDNTEMTYPQVEGIIPTVVNEDIYECSCGYGWDKNKTSRFHFCPNCGKAVGDGNDYKYIKNISNPTGIEFDIDIDKKVESYGKLLKHPVVKHIMGFDEEQEQLDFVQPHKRIPVTLTVSDDLISREAVLDSIERMKPYQQDANDIMEMIQNFPSVKPQESCDVPDTNVGDIISKQTVLDTISELNAISFYEAQEDSKECYYEIRQAIKDLSPVKLQEPKTGHWIVHPKGIYAHLVCDKCLSNAPYDCRTNYCPNCGAKMQEVEE